MLADFGRHTLLDVRCLGGMDDAITQDERFTRLEIKAAYLEKLTLDLNEVVTSQALQLSELIKRFERLDRQLRSAGEERDFPQEKPPHY